jgi:hypothetical protein
VNTTSDPLTQLATIHTHEEIAFIKRVLDGMFEQYNTPRQEIMGLTSMQAMKLAKGAGRQSISGDAESQTVDKGLSHSQAERLLASLLAEGWFERSQGGWYTLSARALMELKGWLVASYNDPDAEEDEWQRIKFCEACKSIVTVGERCMNVDCIVRLHDICKDAFWRTRRGNDKKCPTCDRAWEGKLYVGERAQTMTDAYKRASRRSGQQSQARQAVTEDAEEEVEGEEEE